MVIESGSGAKEGLMEGTIECGKPWKGRLARSGAED